MKVISIISQKGGAGKSTLAVNLAGVFQKNKYETLIIDLDPQGTALTWGDNRDDEPPIVIDSAPTRIRAKISEAKKKGADIVIIDTAGSASFPAQKAVDVSDLVLIPCRPSTFDLESIEITSSLVQIKSVPAYVLFMAGPTYAPNLYNDAQDVVSSYGLKCCPCFVADRAIFRHASGENKTVDEMDSTSKASVEINNVFHWLKNYLSYNKEE